MKETWIRRLTASVTTRMTTRVTVACALCVLASLPSPPRAQQIVDLELVLAVDGSGSMDEFEIMLQRRGYAEALVNPNVQDAIQSGPNGSIAIIFMEWGGPDSHEIVVDWTIISDLKSAKDFNAELLTTPRKAYGYNDIAGAIDTGVAQIQNNDIESLRAVIDVSGDGPNINGRPVTDARDDAEIAGVTGNALAMRTSGHYRGPGGMPLDDYYRRDVIGGFGAFVLPVKTRAEFQNAVLAKLVREIAFDPNAPTPKQVAVR